MKSFKLPMETVLGSTGRAILIGVSENTLYQDGVAKGVDGIKVDILSVLNFERIVVKLPGVMLSDKLQEAVESYQGDGRFSWVTFDGFVGQLYQLYQTKEVKVSATATGIRLLQPVKKEEN